VNYILNIKEDKQNISIINSYEHLNKEDKLDKFEKWNEKGIKENCEIRINGILIPFSFYLIFNKKGKYIILYTLKNNITNANYIFYRCSSLANINLLILIQIMLLIWEVYSLDVHL